jgi:hypothetical protein
MNRQNGLYKSHPCYHSSEAATAPRWWFDSRFPDLNRDGCGKTWTQIQHRALSASHLCQDSRDICAPLWRSRAIWIARKAKVRPLQYASDDLEVNTRA